MNRSRKPGHRVKQLLLVGLLLLVHNSLHAAGAKWQKVAENRPLTLAGTLTIVPPRGWFHLVSDRDGITLTRQGAGLQLIRAGILPHSSGFSEINRVSSVSMLPSELADMMIDKIRKNRATRFARVLDSRPFLLKNRAGFRVLVVFRNDAGLRFYRLVYGFPGRRGIYFVVYQAPALYYYRYNLKHVRKLVRSVKIRE